MRIFIFKRKNIYITLAIILILVGVFIFWNFTRDKTVSNHPGVRYIYGHLTAVEARELIQANDKVVILDVRNKKKYNKGHLENASLLPLRKVSKEQKDLDQGDIHLVYCDNGKASKKAAKILAEAGFPRVYYLVGGYNEWPYGISKPVISGE